MSEGAVNAVLRRKAIVAREVHETRAMTPGRAVRLAMAKAADTLFDLPVTITAMSRKTVDQKGLASAVSDDDLLVLLDGPDGTLGVATADVQVLGALIEQQTMGRVTDRPAAERAPTPTDAALVAPLLDDFFKRLSLNMAGQRDADWAMPYRFGAMIEDVRSLGLAIQATEFECLSLDLDMGGGMKTGTMVVALPLPEILEEVLPPVRDESNGAPWLEPALVKMEAVIDAQLGTVRLPLSQLSDLKPGDVLPVSIEALSEVRLVAPDGKVLGPAHLGRMDEFRAVRLLEDMPGLKDAKPVPHDKQVEGRAIDKIEAITSTHSPDVLNTPPGPAPMTELPDLPGLEDSDGSLPDLPPLDGGGDLPDLPPLDGAPGDLPALPDLPPLDGGGDLPDLPPLDPPGGLDVPDLPDLPDLPKF